MTCRDFENIAGDLASRDSARHSAQHSMEAGLRERALRHAAGCAACAARLNAERALETGLRELAESDENEQAPAHLKFALRAAFDQRRNISTTPVLTFPSSRARYSTRWSLVAAVALILFAIAITLLSRNATPGSNDLSSRGTHAPAPTPSPEEQPPQRVIAPGNLERRVGNEVAGASRSSNKRHARHNATATPMASEDVASDSETVTDYIPLTYLADETAVESGIVVRVELSRSALIAMGLPVNIERTDSRVKADVVLGDDGVARAVRFVQ